MKIKLFPAVPQLPLMMVVIHSFLVVVASGMWLLPSRNATEFGFMLLMIIFIFDLPVQWIFWPVWIYLSSNGTESWPALSGNILLGKVTTCLLFIVIGCFYWFCIGMIIEIIRKARMYIKHGFHIAK